MAYIKYIQNEEHYKEVLSKASKVKEALWIGTADIKDLYVGDEPFLGVLAELVKKGIDVRLIHAKEPGPIFREEFDRYPVLIKKLQRQLCPRVHFKIVVFDYREVYVGSANLTDEFEIVDATCEQFDSVWTGKHCKQCLRKEMCGAPINQ